MMRWVLDMYVESMGNRFEVAIEKLKGEECV